MPDNQTVADFGARRGEFLGQEMWTYTDYATGKPHQAIFMSEADATAYMIWRIEKSRNEGLLP